MRLDINIAPLIDEEAQHYKPSLGSFFSDHINKALLLPFRLILRGIKNVSIQGRINLGIADTSCRDIGQLEWNSPKEVIECLTRWKIAGLEEWKADRLMIAYHLWDQASLIALRMRGGSFMVFTCHSRWRRLYQHHRRATLPYHVESDTMCTKEVRSSYGRSKQPDQSCRYDRCPNRGCRGHYASRLLERRPYVPAVRYPPCQTQIQTGILPEARRNDWPCDIFKP